MYIEIRWLYWILYDIVSQSIQNCSKELTEKDLFVMKKVLKCKVCVKVNLKKWQEMLRQYTN